MQTELTSLLIEKLSNETFKVLNYLSNPLSVRPFIYIVAVGYIYIHSVIFRLKFYKFIYDRHSWHYNTKVMNSRLKEKNKLLNSESEKHC